MLTPNVIWLDLCLAAIGVYLIKKVLNKNPAPYPPGPHGWPLIGNIRDVPQIKPWLTFAEWGKEYGAISHIEILGQHFIVLNSVKSAVDMLDKKSTVYSERPILPVASDLVGWKHSLGLLQYGDRFHQYCKNIHKVIGSRTALQVYHPIEEIETCRFLKRVFLNPEQLQAHIRQYVDLKFSSTAGTIILGISYGYQVKENNDPLINLADRVWFPGAGFKRSAREWRQTLEKMVITPYKFVQDQMLLQSTRFFLAAVLFPDVQKKAQAEIDAVVGSDRLPSFTDRDSLPYTEVLVKEVFRWHAVSPTGIPHCVTEDDIHDGYYIPKGSLVIPNIWLSLYISTYANPSQFNPEHFLDNRHDPEPEPRAVCFGFGRCLFKISKVVENGVEITPEINLTTGTISHPKPFKCSIKPRSAKAVTLILIQQDVDY
ncbi:cytochrome P450 [Suillus spraguei]|nr:cytochrome P450 [Suillus spraguei]